MKKPLKTIESVQEDLGHKHPNKSKQERSLKRKRERTARSANLTGSFDWSKHTIAHKREMITDWTINGGCVGGKRMSKHELSRALGIHPHKLDIELNVVEQALIKTFDSKPNVQAQIFKIIARLLKQIDTDRASAMSHSVLIEKELERVMEERERVSGLPELSATDRAYKNRAENKLLVHFRSMSYHKLESLRVLFESTEAMTKFLNLFTGSKSGQDKDKGLSSLLDNSVNEEPKEGYVDYVTAVRLLDDGNATVLPSQNFSKVNVEPKNPNRGFENFKEPEKE